MTLHPEERQIEVGVRELHDQLSRYLRHVGAGGEVLITMRGRRVARLSMVDDADPLADLRARGVVRDPEPATAARERPEVAGSGWIRLRACQRAAALIVYLDTSALIKLVFDEPGSALAAELWDRAEVVVSSQLVYPEARAAAAAAERGRRISLATLRRAVSRIDELCAELDIVGLDPDLAHRAGELAEAHGLRGYDAVHLATATSIHVENMLLATWDGDLARAAVAAGCSVSPPPSRR